MELLKCRICGKETTQINAAHLKMHGLTSEDYKKMYPSDKMRILSEKQKEIARQKRIELNKSKEMKEKVSKVLKGKSKTEEHKKNLKLAKLNEDKELRRKINGDNRRGKRHTKEAIERISKNSYVNLGIMG